MNIAILGTRGIPGNYGGFETFAEELSRRLVERGHAVTVYCRPNSERKLSEYLGVRLVHLPAIRSKYAETLSHTLLSALHALFSRYDIVYVCNSANAPVCYLPWLRRQTIILNVDGLEWEREKWGRLAKRYYRWAAKLASRMPIQVITDARVIQDYYRTQWNRDTRCFAYGAEIYGRGYKSERLVDMDLEQDGYILYVSRMERENNALLVVEAYRQLDTDLPLVMVGDAPYAQDYVNEVKRAADSRVRFLGFRFGDDYHALQANARIYLQATEVGGTHPALVEALAHGNAVLAHDVPEHREVLGDAGGYFAYRDSHHLAQEMSLLLKDDQRLCGYRDAAVERAEKLYSWEAVTDQYEAYFEELLEAKRR